MSEDRKKTFGEIAIDLAKNPLGIIALFIVLVYGFASLIIAFSGSPLTYYEKLPLVWFLVIFPVFVLGVFTFLVSKHHTKLFGPGDYKNEDNFVKMQLKAVASLATASASAQNDGHVSEMALNNIVNVVTNSIKNKAVSANGKPKRLLWVDDNPNNNIFTQKAFESVGIKVTLAESTDEALTHLNQNDFDAIISDMGRKEGKQEGYVLLDKIRDDGNNIPYYIYAGSNKDEHKIKTKGRGGQGTTNSAEELFQLVTGKVFA